MRHSVAPSVFGSAASSLTRFVVCLALLLALSACSGEEEAAAPETAVVATQAVKPLSEVAGPARGSAAADVVPDNESTLSAEVAGTVVSVAADIGATVKRGETLVQLDPVDFRLALNQVDAQVSAAKAAAAQADARLQRARDLHGRKFISDDDLSVAITNAEAADAELKIRQASRAVAARQLEKARLVAPYDGVVVARMAHVGSAVAPGTPLIKMIDLARPHLEARLQPEQAAELDQAQHIEVEIRGQSYPAQLQHLADAVDPGSRTRVARLTFTGDTPQPGLSGTLHWQFDGYEIPTDLIVQRDGKLGLFTVRDGKASWVEIDDAHPGRSATVSLPGDTRVVIRGQQALQDGDSVREEGSKAAKPKNAATESDQTESEAR